MVHIRLKWSNLKYKFYFLIFNDSVPLFHAKRAKLIQRMEPSVQLNYILQIGTMISSPSVKTLTYIGKLMVHTSIYTEPDIVVLNFKMQFRCFSRGFPISEISAGKETICMVKRVSFFFQITRFFPVKLDP